MSGEGFYIEKLHLCAFCSQAVPSAAIQTVNATGERICDSCLKDLTIKTLNRRYSKPLVDIILQELYGK